MSAYEPIYKAPFEALDGGDRDLVLAEFQKAIASMDLAKSAGSDGYVRGHPKRNECFSHDPEAILNTAWLRLQRLALVGENIGLFSGLEFIRLGLRGVVFPAIKDEWHEERKVFVTDEEQKDVIGPDGTRTRLENPGWRSILMQSTIEYLVQYVLFKRQTLAQVEIVRGGDVEKIICQSSLVGVSTSEDGFTMAK